MVIVDNFILKLKHKYYTKNYVDFLCNKLVMISPNLKQPLLFRQFVFSQM